MAKLKKLDKLTSANQVAFQNYEKEKLTEELIIAYKEFKRTDRELFYQKREKEKRTTELIIANKVLAYENKEKQKRAAELVIANNELDCQNKLKEKLVVELGIANEDLKIKEEWQKEYILGLEEMIFLVSHKIRQPVAHILGLSNLLDRETKSPEELKKMLVFMKTSAQSLDKFTKELTLFIHKIELNARNKT